MADRSAVALLGILQRHGLNIALLETWVDFCERKKTGVFAYHHVNGRIEMYEESHKSRVAAVREMDLTKV